MSRYRNLLLFVLLAAIWGTAFTAIKAGLAYFPPVLFAAIRYDIAGLLMLAYAFYATEQPIPRSRADWQLVAVGGVFLIAGYHALLFVGQQSLTSATAAIVVSLSPVLTTAFARVLLPGGGLTPLGVVGLVLGFFGVVILARPDATQLLTADVVATLLVLGAAGAFALGSVMAMRVDSTLPIETMEGWSMLLGAVLMHLLSAALPGESFAAIEWTPEAIGALVYLAIGASAIGFLLYFDLLSRLGPVEINLVSYVAPIFAAFAGWLWLAETIDAVTVVGFLVIFVGFCLIKRRELARELPVLRAALQRR